MDRIFINPRNSKTSDRHRLLLSLTDKIVLRRCKNSHIRTINLKFQLEHGTKSLNYLKDRILY